MGPVELLFLTVIAIFAVIGIVRGYPRELGVTTMLLLALLLIEFAESNFSGVVNRFFGAVAAGGGNVNTVKAIAYSLFFILVAFISYQGQTLIYPGSGRSPILGFLVGALNGYLLAGSVWYYWDKASWAGSSIQPPYSQFYQVAVKMLPPAVLDWRFLILLLALMLIFRVIK